MENIEQLDIEALYTSETEKTFQYEDELPSLPVPPLQHTLDRYLDSVKPFVSAEEYRQTEFITQQFASGIGKELHEKLVQKAATSRNWLYEWWRDYAYMDVRVPSAPLVNMTGPFPTMYHYLTKKPGTQIERAALIMHYEMCVWKMLRQERLRPDKDGKGTKLCMRQYHHAFSTTRIPCVKRDQLKFYFKTESEGPSPTHLMVMCRGRIFTMAGVDENDTPLTAPELQAQFQIIRDTCDREPMGPGIGSLTGDNRTSWAQIRSHLISLHPQNYANLEEIQKSILCVAFDDSSPENEDQLMKSGLAGDSTNRWFDKAFTLIYYKNGLVASNCDHSPYDAMVLVSCTFYVDLNVAKYKGKWTAASQMKRRGRAYRCRKCAKVDRKARLVAHVFKEHVPMDRAPFYCVLCSFRCQDKKTLLEHMTKYAPHQREEMTRGIRDLSTLLRRGVDPVCVDEQYIEQLSKEDSAMWFQLHSKQALEEEVNLFEDDEDPVEMADGKLVPAWALSPPPVSRVTSLQEYIPTPLDTLSTLLPHDKTSAASSTVSRSTVTTSGSDASGLPNFFGLGASTASSLRSYPPSTTSIGGVTGGALPQPFVLTTATGEKISLYSSPEAAMMTSTPVSVRSEQDVLNTVMPSTTDVEDPLMRGEGMGVESIPSTPVFPSHLRRSEVRRCEVQDVLPRTPALLTGLSRPKVLSSSKVQAVVDTKETGTQTDGRDPYIEILKTMRQMSKLAEEQLKTAVATERKSGSTVDEMKRIERKVTAMQRRLDLYELVEEPTLKKKPEATRQIQSVVKKIK